MAEAWICECGADTLVDRQGVWDEVAGEPHDCRRHAPGTPSAVRLVNLTPHPITVAGHTIAPDGRLPRVTEQTRVIDRLIPATVGPDGRLLKPPQIPSGDYAWRPMPAWSDDPVDRIDIVEVTLGDVTDLPDPEPDTLLVVSRMVAEAVLDRDDLLIPGRQIRDDQGRVIGAASLAWLPRKGARR